MSTIEERLAHVEGSLQQIVLAQQKMAIHQAGQAVELSTAIAVALEEIGRQTGADINVLILLLEKHCELRREKDRQVDLSLVEAALVRLRVPGRESR